MSNPSIMIYVPFALNGNKNTIQVTRQENQDQEDATWNGGFPDSTMLPESSGGLSPKGLDFNGIFYALSADTVHRQSGKQIQYDATYATNIGGYSKGSVVQSSDLSRFWISTIDGNTTDPDSASSSGWNRFAYTPVATSTTTGTVKLVDSLASTDKQAALTASQGSALVSRISNAVNTVFGDYFQGYQDFKDGNGNTVLTYQWGTVDYSTYPGEVQVDITFRKPFSQVCFNAQATRKMAFHSNNGDSGVHIISFNKQGASFSLQLYGPASSSTEIRGFTWFALGI